MATGRATIACTDREATGHSEARSDALRAMWSVVGATTADLLQPRCERLGYVALGFVHRGGLKREAALVQPVARLPVAQA